VVPPDDTARAASARRRWTGVGFGYHPPASLSQTWKGIIT
jgi:hypothetical protein